MNREPGRWVWHLAWTALAAAALACGRLSTPPRLAPEEQEPAEARWLEVAVEPAVVEAGGSSALTAKAGSDGQITFVSPAGGTLHAEVQAGSGVVNIPSGTAPGRYLAALEGDLGQTAFVELQVVDGPSLWIEADRHAAAPGELVEISIGFHDLDPSTVAVLGVGDVDWESEMADEDDLDSFAEGDDLTEEDFETGTGEQSGQLMQPGNSGLLEPTLAPSISLAEWAEGPLFLGGLSAGDLQLIALPGVSAGGGATQQGGDLVLSEPWSLVDCESGGVVGGSAASGWYVQAWTRHGGLWSTSLTSDGGGWSMVLPAGESTLLATPPEGSAAQVRVLVIDTPCGGELAVDLERGTVEVTDAGPTPEVGPQELIMDRGRLRFTGDIAGEFDVLPTCRVREGAVEVIFGGEVGELPLVQLSLPGAMAGGAVGGEVEVGPPADPFTTSTGEVLAEVQVDEVEFVSQLSVTFEGVYAGDGGSGAIGGEFNCTALGTSSGRPSGLASPSNDPGTSRHESPLAQSSGAAICRTIRVEPLAGASASIADSLAAALSNGLELATAYGPGHAGALMRAGRLPPPADFRVIGSQQGGTYSLTAIPRDPTYDRRVSVRAPVSGGDVDLTIARDLTGSLLSALGEAALCLEVTPDALELKAGEEDTVAVFVRNLKGEGVDGAEVNGFLLQCGEWDDSRVEAEGGRAELTYEAGDEAPCRDPNVPVHAQFEGLQADHPGLTARVFDELMMQGEREFEVVLMKTNFRLRASSCDGGYTGPWSGFLGVSMDEGLSNMLGFAGGMAILLGVEGDDAGAFAEAMQVSTELPNQGALILNFSMPEGGGVFRMHGKADLRGEYFAGHDIVVVYSAGQPLFNALITDAKSGTCPE